MSALRDAATRIADMGRFATPSPDRRLACEKAAARLDPLSGRTRRAPEEWDAFLRRIGVTDG